MLFDPDIQPTEEDLKLTKGITQQIGPGKESDPQTVIFVEPVVNGSPPTALAFKELEQSVRRNYFSNIYCYVNSNRIDI